ncbi:MAG: hypothetical protein F6K35_46895, partial [Okeania sp. SIO2H7]|nr:hypothetical protein [Okeania sp. SIO2H7]
CCTRHGKKLRFSAEEEKTLFLSKSKSMSMSKRSVIPTRVKYRIGPHPTSGPRSKNNGPSPTLETKGQF